MTNSNGERVLLNASSKPSQAKALLPFHTRGQWTTRPDLRTMMWWKNIV